MKKGSIKIKQGESAPNISHGTPHDQALTLDRIISMQAETRIKYIITYRDYVRFEHSEGLFRSAVIYNGETAHLPHLIPALRHFGNSMMEKYSGPIALDLLSTRVIKVNDEYLFVGAQLFAILPGGSTYRLRDKGGFLQLAINRRYRVVASKTKFQTNNSNQTIKCHSKEL